MPQEELDKPVTGRKTRIVRLRRRDHVEMPSSRNGPGLARPTFQPRGDVQRERAHVPVGRTSAWTDEREQGSAMVRTAFFPRARPNPDRVPVPRPKSPRGEAPLDEVPHAASRSSLLGAG